MIEHIVSNRRNAQFARMGSGKTSAVLKALSSIKLLDEAPALIVAPLRVARSTWPKECKAWSDFEHLSVTPILGTQTQRFMAMHVKSPFYSINYEMIPWLVEHHGRNWPYRTIIADESTRLKSYRMQGGSKRAVALAKVAHRFENRFIELTGTPSPNGLIDLWGQFWFLDKGQRLGRSFTAFKERWFRPADNGYGVKPFPFAQAQIQDLIRDLALTTDPADYITLDAVIETDVIVEMPAKARAQYVEMEKLMFLELERDGVLHEVEAVNAASRTQKCLQLANGALYVGDALDPGERDWIEVHDAKLMALESIVEEACGAPVLVSYQFRSDLARILRHFPQARYFDSDPATEDAWNAGQIPILVAHPDSAGHGSNLQHGGNILVDFSSGWNLESDDQIIERIGPMRQFQSSLDRPVYRYRIMVEDTVDFMVKDRRESKRSVQSILLEAMKRRTGSAAV